MRTWLVVVSTTVIACSGSSAMHDHMGHHPKGPAVLLDGLGDHHREIATSSPQAQRFFDQGLRLIFAFNYDEAERSFGEAARLDPACVACAWGYALALGPYLNNPTRQEPGAVAAAEHAVQLATAHGTPFDIAFAKALRARVVDPAPDDRTALSAAYGNAMREIGHAYPDDADIQDLTADALYMTVPWDSGLWKPDGSPTNGLTAEIQTLLERALAAAPDHPGLNHLYIHTVEGSITERPKATHAAELLMTAMPSAGHMLHMPSHIFARIGRLAEAEEANRRGIAADRSYLAAHDPGGHYPMMIHHNEMVLWSILLIRGESREGIEILTTLDESVPQMMQHAPAMFHEIFRNFSTILRPQTLVRFARWKDILALPAPPAELKLATAVDHWARGLARVATGQLDQADAELAALDKVAMAYPKEMPMALARPIVDLTREQLAGAIAAARHHYDEAIDHLQKAVAADDQNDPNDEPPRWNMPSRHFLGAVLLAAGRAKDAEAVYREDLRRTPGNGWALAGLAAALKAEDSPEAAEAEKQFHEAWKAADIKTTGSLLP